MNFFKKLMSFISSLLVGIVVSLAILLVGVRLVGLTPYAVLSGSMEPTYHVGSLIYVKAVAPEEIVIGTPITFMINEELVLATHRVVGVEKKTTREEPLLTGDGKAVLDENGQPVMQVIPLPEPAYYFTTKGDANEAIDGARVHHKNVVGTPVFSIPKLGYLSNWLQTPRGMILGGSVALVLLIFTFIPDLLAMVDEKPAEKKKRKKKKRGQAPASPPPVPVEESPQWDMEEEPLPVEAEPWEPVQQAEPPEMPEPEAAPPIPLPVSDAPPRRRRSRVAEAQQRMQAEAVQNLSPPEPIGLQAEDGPPVPADASPGRRRRRAAPEP